MKLPLKVEQCSRCGFFARPGATVCEPCGGPIVESGLPEVIDGRYVIEREIARGAMGIVYLAREESLSRHVAVKVLSSAGAGAQGALERFRREAAAVACLRSEFVVQLYAYGNVGDVPWFAMEYVRGRTLAAILSDHAAHHQCVPVRRAMTLLRQLARGVDAVHAAGMVHRDLKPPNVVVEAKTGRPVLVDFGLSMRGDADRGDGESPAATGRGFVAGTPGYIAPELLTLPQETPTARSDVYSFACLAFQLLTGRPPFGGRDVSTLLIAHRDAPPPRASVQADSVAPDLDGVFERALAKDPRVRHASCGELVRAIAEAQSGWTPLDVPLRDSFQRAPSKLHAPLVLVVDDDAALRKLLTAAVELVFVGQDTEVVAVADGRAAVDVARRRMPSLVLLDYDMPGMDGVEALTQIRELPGGSDARVLVVSASADAQNVRWRFDVLGADDFLRKPFQLRDVVDAVARVGLVRQAEG